MQAESSEAAEVPVAPGSSSLSAGREALDHLFSATYEELRRLAATVRHGDSSATISPTALVNEAWMKLSSASTLTFESPLHFKRVAARAMRQVLVEAARRRQAEKRGGGDVFVTFDDSIEDPSTSTDDIIALDGALDALAQLSPRQALLVESRFFGGLDVQEAAALIGVSEATALRDWRAARAWLALELARTR